MVHAWHFLNCDGTAHGGYRPPPVGELETVAGPLVICNNGLHGSRLPLDALRYSGGSIVRRTVHSGEIIEQGDKLCSTRRRAIWQADANYVLHEFACWCAEEALKREEAARRAVDARSWNAIHVKRAWLRGEATGEELDAARAAAWAAAWAAARAATWAAAGDATWAAAGDATWAAAGDATWAAAGDAARAAAWAAARAATWAAAGDATWAAAGDAARAAAWDAAWAATWAAAGDAAWAAAWDAQNKKLTSMLLALGREARHAQR